MIKNLLLAFLSGSMIMAGINLPVLAHESESFEEIEFIIENTDDNEGEEINEEIIFPEAGSIIHSGEIGTAHWTIDSNGTLTIGAGKFENNGHGYSWPWNEYRKEILRVDGTYPFIAKGNYASAFASLSQVKYIDLSGWNTSQINDMSFMFWNCPNLD